MYGSPEHLVRLAQRIDDRAAELARDATILVVRADATRWESTAAAAHRRRIERTAVDARRVARRLEDAAAALRAHAHRVATAVTEIELAERRARHWFDHAISAVEHGVHP